MAFGDIIGTAFVGTANSISNPFSTSSGGATVAVDDLVYCVLVEQNNLTTTAVTDNLGNAYQALNVGDDAGNVTAIAFYSIVTVPGTITALSATTVASSDNVAFIGAAFQGPFLALDANPLNGTTDLASPFTCPASGALAQANELVVAWGAANYSTAWTAVAPNVERVEAASQSFVKAIVGSQVVASQASVAPQFQGATNPTQIILGTSTFRAGQTGAARLVGAGGLKVETVHTPEAAGRFDGAGGLAAFAVVPKTVTADAALDGSGGVVARAAHTPGGEGVLDGSGSVAGAAVVRTRGAAKFSGAGALAADATWVRFGQTFQASALLDGGGGLKANIKQFTAGLYDSTGATQPKTLQAMSFAEFEFGLRIVTGDVAHGDTLDFRVYVNGQPLTEYAQTPQITVGGHDVQAEALLDGVGGLKAQAAHTPRAAAKFSGAGELAAAASTKTRINNAALLAGAGALSCDAAVVEAVWNAEAALAGEGALHANAMVVQFAAARLDGEGGVAAHAGLVSVLAQEHFRYRIDGEVVDAEPTWAVPQDTNEFYPGGNVPFRIRIGVANNSKGDTDPLNWQIRVSKNGGAYTQVTTTSPGVKSFDAGASPDAAPIDVRRLA